MNPLVTFEQGEPRTTTLVLAEGTQNSHKTVMQLVRKYQDDLGEFGPCAFQMLVAKRTQGGGTQGEVVHLNEPQATLIMTYMKNTEVVRRFKKALVKAFFELRDMAQPEKTVNVNMNHTRGVTNQHGLDIKYSLDLTKICMRPTRQGIAILERITGIDMSDIAASPEMFPEAPAVDNMFSAWETERLVPMAGMRTGATIIYKDFKDWYQQSTGLPVPAQKWFGNEMNRRRYRKEKRGGNVYYIGVALASGEGVTAD